MRTPTVSCQWNHNMSNPSPPPPPPPQHRTRLLHTAFYWGKDTQILFHGWPGTSTAMYILALFFVFTLGVLVEFFTHLTKFFEPGSSRFATCMFQTGLHAVRSGFAYLVVLALTSFNAGIFLAALLGHSVGYSIFRSGLCFNKQG